MAEGRLGGEFFTPHAIVRLIVEIIEPYSGRVFDPACGSGGMFVQFAKFVERHKGSATEKLSVFGQEQKEVTVPLAKMNLALHGVSGDFRLGNSYYDDIHSIVGAFDFVMANPPFNVDRIDKDLARRKPTSGANSSNRCGRRDGCRGDELLLHGDAAGHVVVP